MNAVYIGSVHAAWLYEFIHGNVSCMNATHSIPTISGWSAQHPCVMMTSRVKIPIIADGRHRLQVAMDAGMGDMLVPTILCLEWCRVKEVLEAYRLGEIMGTTISVGQT